MSVHYKKGVILLLLLHLSCSVLIANETEEERYFDEEDYEYESYPDDEDDGVIRSIPKDEYNNGNHTTAINIPNTHTTSSDVTVTANPIRITQCPENCECDEDYQFVNCSNSNLSKVPSNIPEKVRIIDLRFNTISSLGALDFINCSRLRDIYLSGNKITNIEKELFINMKKLEYIDLENNTLTKIDQNTFSEALALIKINLNNNPIQLPENDSFLNQPNLKELYLRNCALTQIYDQTFKNLRSLQRLDLSENKFGMSINPNAFEPLKELSSLTLPHIEKESFKSLCEVLASIDVIYSKEYNVSCFELVSGASFEGSVTEGKNITDSPNAPYVPTKYGRNKAKVHQHNMTIVSPPTLLELNEETATGIHNKKETNNGTTKDDPTYQVEISSQIINNVLIAIIIIAIVGLAIGMLCRKDICGIKTKMCRTRRPPTTDQVRPAEEVPLNKV